MKSMIKNILIITLLWVLCPFYVWSQTVGDSLTEDSLQRLRMTPNFIQVSVCIASRGDVLYSNTGHAFIRMQCPTFEMDNCFSYEGEDVEDNLYRFFTGNLKMGMARWKSDTYINEYKKQGRGLKEYYLNLSPETKMNLWRILDSRVEEGMNLPYDPVKRGCAHSVIEVIMESLGSDYLLIDRWPERFDMSLREMIATSMTNDWSRFVAHFMCSTYPDGNLYNLDKTAAPSDLIDVLRIATVNGQHILTEEPKVLLQTKIKDTTSPFTPVMMAIVILVLTLVGLYWLPTPTTLTVVTIQSLIGLFVTYLFLSGNLLGGIWTILLVPFNPLPILLWHWRKWWAGLYAIILFVWLLIVWFYPHQLTDPAFPIITIALVIVYIKQSMKMIK